MEDTDSTIPSIAEHVLAQILFPLLVEDYGLNEAHMIMLLSKRFLRLTKETRFWLPYLRRREEIFSLERAAMVRPWAMADCLCNSYLLIPPAILEQGGILAVVQSKRFLSTRNLKRAGSPTITFGTVMYPRNVVEGCIIIDPETHGWKIDRTFPFVSYRSFPTDSVWRWSLRCDIGKGLLAKMWMRLEVDEAKMTIRICWRSGLVYEGPYLIRSKKKILASGGRFICTGGEVLNGNSMDHGRILYEFEGVKYLLGPSLPNMDHADYAELSLRRVSGGPRVFVVKGGILVRVV